MKRLLSLLLLLLICWPGTAIQAEFGSNDAALVAERVQFLTPRIPGDHPRLMLTRSELPEFRRFVMAMRQRREYPAVFKNVLIPPSGLPLPDEPPAPHGKGFDGREIWRKGYQTAFYAGSQAQQYAFSYLLSGDPVYGREAARWLLHLAGWDVNGGINIRENDEAFIQSLRPMLYAYDWAHDALTPPERRAILQALDVRLKILFPHITRKFSLDRPTPPDNSLSHPLRFISTLGIAGLVLYQDLPEAPTYLAWAYEYYLRRFPVWGGADGGWSEGLNYWATATNQHFQFLDAMQALNLTEILQKPFFRNTGYFALYNLEPFPASSFGDLCNVMAPNPNIALIFEKLALFYQDPYFLQYFRTIFERYPSGRDYYQFSYFDTLFQLYRKDQSQLAPRSLAELPRSRFFRDIGWVAMHSALGGRDDIMLGFKSSPYGSASHSFSDQNSLVLNAFGEPLAISSGYREWYDSPHHLGWTRTTRSKNAVLFGGEGQPVKDASATGTIRRFYTGPGFDFASGDATPAYRKAGARQALRHVLFVDRRYFIVFDELQSGAPVSYQWLLHAKEPFAIVPAQGTATMERHQAGLRVMFLEPEPGQLDFSQTDRFSVPVDPHFAAKLPPEWHLTVAAERPQTARDFLTLLQPYRLPRETAPAVRVEQRDSGYRLMVADHSRQDQIMLTKEGRAEFKTERGRLHGKAGVITTAAGKPVKFLLIDGRLLQGAGLELEASRALSLEGAFSAAGLRLSASVPGVTELRIRLPFVPQAISGIPGADWRFDRETQCLFLKLTRDGTIQIQ
ncbi:heparinase II/III-like protein [Hydrogenispora ethanolica]|uniref:Heparinase II/III-like protein n=1 Tax=Hydrogenispora ethanolica TaxID=1082276 RepID=A0A4R1S520_HYDET|nr:DUF4962 domain-containing protein [Hydrogenispora ethanolica]TCL74104.1 heparinase II/III-like protein [Hydrogenispora ethanolica]